MDVLTFVFLIAGGVILVVGAEGLVRGAARLAVTAGISPVVVGLTIVAFATSSPELAVSIAAAVGGDPDIAVGNVVGSNIFNVLLILGLAAAITPLVVHRRLIFLEAPLMIAVCVLMFLASLGGTINRLEGLGLVAALAVYLAWLVWETRRENNNNGAAEHVEGIPEKESSRGGLFLDLGLIAVGLAMLIGGSNLFVRGATDIAESLGVSQLVIGLTVVAIGTSLPEIATSVLASLRGERDIAVGNVIGSNIFNVLAVIGVTAVVADGGIAVAEAAQQFDMPIMIGVAVLLVPVLYTSKEISRWEGGLFLAYFAAYIAYLVLDASSHQQADTFRTLILGFAVPITAITLLYIAIREAVWLRKRHEEQMHREGAR